MRRLSISFAVSAMIIMITVATGQADAQRRNERQVRDIVRTLNAQIDEFQYGLDHQLRSTSSPSNQVEEMHDNVRNLQTQVDDFEENLNNRRENRDDVRAIIMAAIGVDAFLMGNPQNRKIDTSWQSVQSTISNLASNYGVTPDWKTSASNTTRDSDVSDVPAPLTSSPPPSNAPRISTPTTTRRNNSSKASTVRSGLTGTYALDTSRSDVPGNVLAEANVGESDRTDLEAKLEAPQQMSIDVRGTAVTMTTSKVASPVKFVADGREKTESANGKPVRIRATLRGEELTIARLSGETDYTVVYTPIDNGRALKVTRRITTETLPETIFAESIYTKTEADAGIGLGHSADTDNAPDVVTNDKPSGDSGDKDAAGGYSSSDSSDRGASPAPTASVGQTRTGNFIVPNGTMITGMLDSSIDTKVTQNNDRFRMTVQAPNDFRGATVEGYVTGVGRSGQVSGRSNVTLNFESITLRDGQRYDFAGFLQSITDAKGKQVKVDSEGAVRGGSRTKDTVTRGGLGAGLGAIIGAIAGGGTGAAIGAAIGGGAGAGSVLIEGREDLRLAKGTMITVQASSSTRDPRTLSKK